MPDVDEVNDGKNFRINLPAKSNVFFLKGSNSLDWGMKNRLARVFNPITGRTVMLAFDHGYFQGPTTGLERIDLNIVPLIPYADALMTTRGALRSSIPAESNKAVVLRCSGGQSILKELSNELVAVAIEDAIRVNAAAMAVQVYIGGQHEHQSIRNLVSLIDAGYHYGIPTLGVTGVGKELVRDAKYLGLATRIAAELGAHFVKTYFCEKGFERVVAGCPVPLVVAGGKKLPELDALTMAYKAVDQGAAGVDMGRNIFQSEAPVAMIKAVRSVVHQDETPERAFELYRSLKNERHSAGEDLHLSASRTPKVQ
ncbi:MAG: 3-hydroxy-5-phosphonooxypentane-2,4-dione thiolase [Acidobacteria bacterium]|nr:MAG: 3-hydroxy-5-phosphonooxypentane-2,4-dione thiolase [Acidobacteriota bacterium]